MSDNSSGNFEASADQTINEVVAGPSNSTKTSKEKPKLHRNAQKKAEKEVKKNAAEPELTDRSSRLTNVGRLYEAQLQTAIHAWKEGKTDVSDDMAYGLLWKPDLPELFRAWSHLLIALGDGDDRTGLYHAEQAVEHFEALCVKIPGDLEMQKNLNIARAQVVAIASDLANASSDEDNENQREGEEAEDIEEELAENLEINEGVKKTVPEMHLPDTQDTSERPSGSSSTATGSIPKSTSEIGRPHQAFVEDVEQQQAQINSDVIQPLLEPVALGTLSVPVDNRASADKNQQSWYSADTAFSRTASHGTSSDKHKRVTNEDKAKDKKRKAKEHEKIAMDIIKDKKPTEKEIPPSKDNTGKAINEKKHAEDNSKTDTIAGSGLHLPKNLPEKTPRKFKSIRFPEPKPTSSPPVPGYMRPTESSAIKSSAPKIPLSSIAASTPGTLRHMSSKLSIRNKVRPSSSRASLLGAKTFGGITDSGSTGKAEDSKLVGEKKEKRKDKGKGKARAEDNEDAVFSDEDDDEDESEQKKSTWWSGRDQKKG